VRKTFRNLMVVGLLAVPALANATPMQWVFDFGPSFDGQISSGTGSFYWDADTHAMSNLSWDLGEGRVGSVPDSTVDWDRPGPGGGTLAEFAFEVLTGLDTWAGAACGDGITGCIFGLVHEDDNQQYPNMLVGWPFQMMNFSLMDDGLAQYSFALPGDQNPHYIGTRTLATLAPSAVPEPGTLALLGAAALAFAFWKRRKIEATT
jgi:hypothetical protein